MPHTSILDALSSTVVLHLFRNDFWGQEMSQYAQRSDPLLSSLTDLSALALLRFLQFLNILALTSKSFQAMISAYNSFSAIHPLATTP